FRSSPGPVPVASSSLIPLSGPPTADRSPSVVCGPMSPTVAPDDLRRQVETIRRFPTVDLGGGIVPPGETHTERSLPRLRLPDLTGREVLDIGAWDGFFSFAAERRGAARVLATYSFPWGGRGWGTRAGFDLARAALGSHVEDAEVDVMDLDPAALGTFDVVLVLGGRYDR